MSLIKNIIRFFSPQAFKNDPYGWLTNQIGHIAGSAWITYVVFLSLNSLTNLPETSCKWIAIGIIGGLWIFWEVRHLVLSGDWKDFFEDLTFELTGVAIVYHFVIAGIIFSPILVLSLLWIKYGEILRNPPEEALSE